jgi:hypothetical protein
VNLNFLKSAFDRIGEQSKQLDRIAAATELTAASVTVGGVLFTKMDEMVKLLRVIANNGASSGKEAIKDAKALAIVGNSMEPLGKGFQILVQALNELPDGKKAAKKMDALVGGLVKLGEIGDAIVSFAFSMIIATPLLLVSALLAPIWVPGLMFTLNGLMFAAEGLDKKTLKNISLLGNVGLSILALAGSLALVSLIGMQAIEGALYAGLILIGITKVLQIMSTMLNPKVAKKQADALLKLSMGIAVLGGVLALISLIGPQMLKGAFFAAGAILILGGVLALIDVLIPLEKVSEFNKSIAALGLGLLAVAAGLYVFTVLGAQLMKGALIFVGTMMILAIGLSLIGGLDTDDDFGKKMLNLGLGILAIGASLALISFIGPYMLKGAFYTAGALLIIGGTFWLLDQMKILNKIEMGAKAMLKTAISILAIGVALALFNIIAPPPEDILKIGIIIGAVALAFGLIGIKGKTILKGARAMGFAALSILALGLSLYFFDMLVPGDILSMETLKAFIVIGAIGAGFYLAGKGAAQIIKGALSMLVAGVALIVIGFGVSILNAAIPEENGWERIGMMGALIGGLGIAMGLAGLAAPYIIAGSAAMMVAGISLLVIGIGVKGLDAALGDNGFERIGQYGALIALLGVEMAAFGLLAPFIMLGSAAMMIAGLALIPIGIGLGYFTKLDIGAMFKSGGLFADSGQKTKGFLGIGGGRPKSNMEVMFEAIADSMSLGPLSLIGLYAGAPAFIMAGAALILIGKGISEFQKIAEKTDLKSLNNNVNMIVTSLSDSFARIGTLYPGGGGSIFSGGSVVAQGVSATLGMGRALTGIARGMQAMANLQFPVEFDKEGNPIKFESMNSDAPMKVATNAAMITSVLANVFGEIGTKYPGGKKGLFASIFGGGRQSPVADGISSVMGMGDALAGIALGVQAMADLKFPTKWDKEGKPIAFETVDIPSAIRKVNENVKLILLGDGTTQGLVSVFTQVGQANGPDKGWFTSTDYEKGVEMIQNVGTPLLNLAEGVQMMANLKFPTKYDKDGKAIAFADASDIPSKLKQVEKNVKLILLGADGNSGLVGIFKKLGAEDDSGWFSSSTIEKGAEIAKMISEPIKNIADAASKLMEGKWDATDAANKIKILIGALTSGNDTDPKLLNTKRWLWIRAGEAYEKMGQSIPSIINALNTVNPEGATAFRNAFWGAVDAKDPAAGYAAQGYAWTRIGDAMPKVGDGMQVTAEAINNMDLEKIVEARTMFEALAALTHGGEPADILAQMGASLEDALQNLADMLTEFKGSVEQGAASTNELGSTMKDIFKKPDNTAAAKPAAQQQAPPEVDVSSIVAAIEDLESTLTARGIRVTST